MKKFGVGLVAYEMKRSDIEMLSRSLLGSNPCYQVVVDNSFSNVSKEIFESNGWTYIHSPENPGFGASHNLIFNRFGGEGNYHLIVNPDVVFSSHVIERLIGFLESKPQAGCVMPKIYYPDGRIQKLAKLLPSPLDWIGRRLPWSSLKKRINRRLELHLANYESGTFKVPFVSGCFLLFRSEVINQIGFFDTRYFMYAEDTDLSRRLYINESWPYYFGATSIVHRYEKGSSKSLRLFKIHVQSALRYFNKWGWIDRERLKINRDCLEQFYQVK